MSTITNPSKPYNFTNGTIGEAPEVNSDFDIIYAKALEIIAAINNIDAANITAGTLALARIPTTLTGKDADSVDTFHASQTPGANQIPVLDGSSQLNVGNVSVGGETTSNFYVGTSDVVLRTNDINGNIFFQNYLGDTTWGRVTPTGFTRGPAGYVVWDSANDGSGSGLDADTVDGVHASQTPGANQIPVLNSDVELNIGNVSIGSLGTSHFYMDAGAGANLALRPKAGGKVYFQDSTGATTWGNVANTGFTRGVSEYTVWDSGNDGSGSGLDADKLDGSHASATPGSAIIPIEDSSGRIAWGAKPAFRGALVYNNTQVTGAFVPFSAESYDTDAIHDNVTNKTRLTVPSGVTRIRVRGQALFSATTVHTLTVTKNNSSAFIGHPLVESNSLTLGVHSSVLTVNAGDYFELLCDGGSTVNTDSTGQNTWFAMEIIE